LCPNDRECATGSENERNVPRGEHGALKQLIRLHRLL
jgi:hypothetical protein